MMAQKRTAFDFLVSVIIPVYNAANYVEEAAQSALNQPETGEVILVEDGSKDNSLSICQNLAKKYPNVHCYTHDDFGNHGVSASRNLGILKSNYSYFTILDADDYYLKGAFKKAKETFLKYPDALGVYGTHTVKYENSELAKTKKSIGIIHPIRPNVKPEELFDALISEKWTFSIVAIIINKKLLPKNLIFDETLKLGQDTDFIRHLILAGKLYPGSIEQPVFTYRIHHNNRVHNTKAAKKYRYQNNKYWYHQIPKNNWKRATNRRITLLMLDGKITNKNTIIRKIRKGIYLGWLILQNPKILKKLL